MCRVVPRGMDQCVDSAPLNRASAVSRARDPSGAGVRSLRGPVGSLPRQNPPEEFIAGEA